MSMLGYGIAELHSAVRGVHEYRVFPNRLAQLELHIDLDSTFKNSVGVYCVDNHSRHRMVGHVAREHSRLVYKWLKTDNRVTAIITDDRVRWSRRAGHEMGIDLLLMSKDEEQMKDLQASFTSVPL